MDEMKIFFLLIESCVLLLDMLPEWMFWAAEGKSVTVQVQEINDVSSLWSPFSTDVQIFLQVESDDEDGSHQESSSEVFLHIYCFILIRNISLYCILGGILSWAVTWLFSWFLVPFFVVLLRDIHFYVYFVPSYHQMSSSESVTKCIAQDCQSRSDNVDDNILFFP